MLKKDLNSKLVKKELYVINKKNPKFKARQGYLRRNDYKKTSGFKFVLAL